MPLREENSRKEETTWSVTFVIGQTQPREKGILVQYDWKDHNSFQYDSQVGIFGCYSHKLRIFRNTENLVTFHL